MTKDQQENMVFGVSTVSARMIRKYKAGQKQHSGNLWEKSGMLKNLEDEHADMGHYLYNLREQLLELRRYVGEQKAIELLEKILSDVCG